MEVIRVDLENSNLPKIADSIFVIGRFQTLHKGHQALFQEAKKRFPNKHLGVMTFYPDPRDFFTNERQKKVLTYAERLNLLQLFGVEIVIEFVFNTHFANLSRQDFIDYMSSMGIDTIFHGSDFRYGKQGDGSGALQTNIFHKIDDYQIANVKVSSSLIAADLQRGDVETVNNLLGYCYFINGTVIQGSQIARTLGFPTANLKIDLEKLCPGNGVYITTVEVDGQCYYSVTHIGDSPTFNRQEICIESHLLDFSGDLYQKTMKVTFFQKIRDVQTFKNISEVKKQIVNDVVEIRHYFNI